MSKTVTRKKNLCQDEISCTLLVFETRILRFKLQSKIRNCLNHEERYPVSNRANSKFSYPAQEVENRGRKSGALHYQQSPITAYSWAD